MGNNILTLKNKRFKIHQIWILSQMTSLLLSIPFIAPHMGIVSLVAFVPLFVAEHIASENNIKRFFFVYYVSFLMWNLVTTFWVWFATPAGASAAFLLNSLQMAIVFTLFRWVKRYTKGILPYLFFIFAWLAWEHLYFTWQVSWTWLTLGNSFATSIKNIQWYEYTGTLGGSLWILLSNVLLFRIMLLFNRGEKVRVSLISYLLLIIIPIITSYIIFNRYQESENPAEFTVLQPNIDPYTDKFDGLTQDQQNRILIDLMNESNKGEERIILAPETFVGWVSPRLIEGHVSSNPNFMIFEEWVYNSNSPLILGAVTHKIYNSIDEPTETATKVGTNMWMDKFNASIYMDNSGKIDYYHKSKLVILAESNPFSKGPFKFVEKLMGDIAGGIGNFGTQPEVTLFTTPKGIKIGTAICYESIFGDYYREYVLAGADVMGIITNDGWWKDTPGHKQHLSYASLRAIETRRSIARSANTGISCFINQKGEIVDRIDWWERGYLNGKLNLNDKITTFVKYGDIIGRVSCFITGLLLLMAISLTLKNKRTRR